MKLYKNKLDEYVINKESTALLKIGVFSSYENSLFLKNDGLMDHYYSYTDLPN